MKLFYVAWFFRDCDKEAVGVAVAQIRTGDGGLC